MKAHPTNGLPRSPAVWLGLAAILLVGAFFRFDGLRWDAGGGGEHHLHPDERFLTMVASSLDPPDTAAGYFDSSTSPLNPLNRGHRFFVYGTLPLFLVRGVAGVSGMTGYDEIHLVGRFLAAGFSLATIFALWLLARRLYGGTVAWLAALLLALAVLPIQQAHFFVVDAFAGTFVVLGLLAAVGISRRGGTSDYVWFGLALGAGMACKISVYLLATVAAVAATTGFLARRRAASESGERSVSPAPVALRLWLSAVVAFAVFRVLQPYAFAGPGVFDIGVNDAWWRNLQEVRELMGGWRDYPPGHQWADRTSLWFPWINMVTVGLGPALGLAAWSGWCWAGWQLFKRRRWQHLVPWSWVLLVFVVQGRQFVMTLRYLLPIYPVLALFAAWFVVELGKPVAATPRGAWRRRVAFAVGTVMVVGTVAWAWAFTSIYRRPHSRIEASRWIYEHVPPGSRLAVEVWDDPLPLALDGREPDLIYRRLELSLYDEDTPLKLERLLEALERTDYIVLSSDRLVESIPRLPMRYPMTTLYYRHLLSGELGFRKAIEITSHPRALGYEIDDQWAEEAFSVYDHPRVRIFEKTPAWSRERAEALLSEVDWGGIDRVLPREARRHRRSSMGKTLRTSQATGGTWSAEWGGLFDPASGPNRRPVGAWVLTLMLLGVVAFPLTFAALGRLRDGGWMVSRTVGLLCVGTTAWLLASLRWLPFSRGGVWWCVLALGLASLGAFHWRRPEIVALVRSRWRLLLAEEVIFWILFGLLLSIRYSNPDLWHPFRGGEKPMDFAYLNTVLKATWFPPLDPWFSGLSLNYYYFGFVLAAVPVLLTGVVPEVAYNLLLPTFFALTAAGAFTATALLGGSLGTPRTGSRPELGHSSLRYLGAGLVGAVFVALIGNLAQVGLFVRSLTGAEVPDHAWFWNASRAIPHARGEPPPITEFPFFGFLYGDLHAHLMALPLALLALTVVVYMVVEARPGKGTGSASWPPLVLLSLTGGALWPTNAWDYPTWLALTGVALLLSGMAHRPFKEALPWAGWRFVAVVVVGRLLFLPFAWSFESAYTRIEPWRGSQTTMTAFLTIHGLFVFVLATWLAVEVSRRWKERRAGLRPLHPGEWLVLSLIGLGLALAVGVELLVVRGDVGRMNTVFKSYLQIWWLWGVAAAAVLPLLLRRARRRPVRWAAWGVVLAVLLGGGLLYPILATPKRVGDRFVPELGPGLSGERFMEAAVYEDRRGELQLRWDLEAIRWLRESVRGSPPILEAALPPYGWGSRVSVHTGLPTVVGWESHQRQQRAPRLGVGPPADPVRRRLTDVRTIYSTGKVDRARELLLRYGVRYVYVGQLESLHYPASGLAKFDREDDLFRLVHENPGVRIYEVLP